MLRHQGSRQRRTLPGVVSYWARPVSIFNINLSSSLFLQYIRGSIIFKGSRVSKVLDFYRVYCTKQNLRSYHTSCQGNIEEWKYQAYHMHLGIKQLLIT